MNYLFVLPQTHYDDSAWHGLNLARALFSRGHDVRVALCEHSPLLEAVVRAGLVAETVLSPKQGLLGRVRQSKAFKMLQSRFAPDYLIGYGRPPAGWRHLRSAKLIAAVWDWNAKVPWVKKADRVIATCESIRGKLIARYAFAPASVATLYGGLDPADETERRKERDVVRKRFAISENNILIGILGAVNDTSGHELLMRSLSQDYHPNLKLLALVEEEAEIDRFKQMARRYNISSVAHAVLRQPDCTACLEALDLGVIADLKPQGIARRTVELMAAGVPVVASMPGADCELCNPENRYEHAIAAVLMDRIISHGENSRILDSQALYEAWQRLIG